MQAHYETIDLYLISFVPACKNMEIKIKVTKCNFPARENMLSSFGMTAFALVVVTISTSGNRLNSSIITSSSSPDGNGPTKSTATSCHGASGSGVKITE